MADEANKTDDPVDAAINRKLGALSKALALAEKHGVVLLILCGFAGAVWTIGGRLYNDFYHDFAIPVRDGHLDYLQKSGEAQKDTAKAVEAIKQVVEDTRADNAAMRAMGMDHYDLTRETRDDVREIKAVVVPPKTSKTPTPAPPLVVRPPAVVLPN